jgi:hypothetical protein
MYVEATGRMVPSEPRQRSFTKENFPSQSDLQIASLENYLEIRSQHIGKPRGEAIAVPTALLNKGAREAALHPIHTYTPDNFPTYELLEYHGTPELTRRRYKSLRGHYLGQPIPRQETSACDDYFMKKGMTWPQAYIAAAMSYE